MSVREAGGGQSIPGGGVGGAPPPGNGFATGKGPHFVPLCNTEPASGPTLGVALRGARGKTAVLQAFCRGTIFMQIKRRLARRAAARGNAGGRALSGGVLDPVGGEVGGFTVSVS